MAKQAGLVWNIDAADDQFAAGDEGVAVIALADTKGKYHSCPCRKEAASAISCGSVILKLRGLPCTSFGCSPSISMALASSVMSQAHPCACASFRARCSRA